MVVTDLPPGVDEVVGGPVLVLERPPDGELIVHGDRIGDSKALDVLADVGLGLLKGELGRVHADHHQTLVLVLLSPGTDVGDGTDAVDAGVGPEIDHHHLALQLLGRERRGVDPGRRPGQRRHHPFDRQIGQIGRGLVRRHSAPDPAQQRLFDPARAGGRNPGQQSRVRTQTDDDHADQHQHAQAAPYPFADAQRALHGLEHATTDQQGQTQ